MIEELIRKAREIIKLSPDQVDEEYNKATFDFIEDLRDKYDDADKYAFLHALSGGSSWHDVSLAPKLDFEGEDSIGEFVDRWHKRIVNEN